MSVLNENTIIGASAAGGDYEIEQSLRFDEGRETRLIRTPTTNGSATTWTWSAWVKRSELSNAAQSTLFAAGVYNGSSTHLHFAGDNTLHFYQYDGGYKFREESTQVFRDTSAWYHIVAVVDTTNGTAADRIKLYVNGVQITSFANVLNPNQNQATFMNLTANKHYIGDFDRSGDGDEFGGYLAEVNFIDGQALTPDSFGETGDYGEWKPIAYAGTYGTNGFYLPFEQDYSVEGFSTVVYEATQANQYIGGTGFQPDFIWFKNRTRSSPHRLVDAVRGIPKTLSSDTTVAESTGLSDGTVNRLVTGLTADGFTLGMDDGGYRINSSTGDDIVAWCWDMGGTTASNTSGSITSSVRANTAYGQSIVSYTGNATRGATVGHGLTAAPDLIITKSRSAVSNWFVYHSANTANPETEYLTLETTNDTNDLPTVWADTAPTSTVFSIGDSGWNNTSGATYIAYCFHDVANYSKFGSYSGTGSSNAITTGFAPAFVMIKRTNRDGDSWAMFDNTRNPINPVTKALWADTSGAEYVEANALTFTNTGFTVNVGYQYLNNAAGTYIYMAFADTREYAYWYDQSGNNNDWTSEGGLTESDVMVDSPTNNFATLNPLLIRNGASSSTFSEGNLTAVGSSTYSAATIEIPASGKFYAESYVNLAGTSSANVALNYGSDIQTSTSTNRVVYAGSNGQIKIGSTVVATGATYTTGDIIGVAADTINGTVQFFKNNVSQGTVTKDVSSMFIFIIHGGSWKFTMNFGQDSSFAGNKTPQGNADSGGIGDFYYAPSSGFLALCTKSLPSVDVIPSEHFSPVIYSGASTDYSVAVGFQPDFTWIKRRNGTASNNLMDSVRGVSERLRSDTNGAATSLSGFAFESNGFSPAHETSDQGDSGGTFAAWNWKAGGSAVSNTNGTITSQVSTNPAAGFSIVSWTHGSGSQSIGHGLSQKPDMMIVKKRSGVSSFWTWHKGLSSETQSFIHVNTTNAAGANANAWNNQAPTASVFYQKEYILSNNDTGIAYCFHSVEGYSKVGSFIGNGNVDGAFVHCGFKPAFLLFRRSTETGSWFMFDNARGTTYNVSGTNFDNVRDNKLNADANYAEDADSSWNIDFLSNGFKLRSPHVYMNGNNLTHIFIAFAESPFKHTNAH